MSVPAVVEEAVAGFDADGSPFTLLPPTAKERSLIFKWGVRVKHSDREDPGWICLGGLACRTEWTFYPLHSGKTSNATRHLKDVHGISSSKTEAETQRKRSREDLIEHLKASPMFAKDSKRLHRLLKTERIVFNNLPFQSEEYERSRGLRRPFRRWLTQMLADFGIKTTDVFAAMSDAGADVKWMMSEGLALPWEWCIPHMLNVATKFAFGLDATDRSKNVEMRELVDTVHRMIRTVKKVEMMGSLFAALCAMEGKGKKKTLLTHHEHRFLAFAHVVERLLELWSTLERWYQARTEKAKKPVKPFPLAGKFDLFVQVLSVLKSVVEPCKFCQSESPVQVHALLRLYLLRMDTVNKTEPLCDYRSSRSNKRCFDVSQLDKLVTKTRAMLADALDKRFFKRYTDTNDRLTSPYLFEIHLFLHPQFKRLDNTLVTTVRFCNIQKGHSPETSSAVAQMIKMRVRGKVKQLMLAAAEKDHASGVQPQPAADCSSGFPDDLVSFFGEVAEPAYNPTNAIELRVEAEMQRRTTEDPVVCNQILNYWRDQQTNFKYLSQVARMVFGFPTSSAQIERDFGMCGRMVTSLRSSLSGTTVDMSSFLCANQDLVDLTQCDRVPADELSLHIPSHVLVGELDDMEDEWLDVQEVSEIFSAASIDTMEM